MYILDVRTPEEFAAGHVAGALNAPSGIDVGVLAWLRSPGARVVVYCKSGRRSETAVAELRRRGYTDVVDAMTLVDALKMAGRASVGDHIGQAGSPVEAPHPHSSCGCAKKRVRGCTCRPDDPLAIETPKGACGCRGYRELGDGDSVSARSATGMPGIAPLLARAAFMNVQPPPTRGAMALPMARRDDDVDAALKCMGPNAISRCTA